MCALGAGEDLIWSVCRRDRVSSEPRAKEEERVVCPDSLLLVVGRRTSGKEGDWVLYGD